MHDPATVERFMRHVEMLPVDCGCWLWTGGTDGGAGYGNFSVGGKRIKAHRFSFEAFNGPVQPKTDVMHVVCDLPSCVRPDHLALGSRKDNGQDMSRKNRGTRSRRGLPYGVSFDPLIKSARKYGTQFAFRGARYHCGHFETAAEAHTAVLERREAVRDHYERTGEVLPGAERRARKMPTFVRKIPSGRFVGQCMVNRVSRHTRVCDTPEEALALILGMRAEMLSAKEAPGGH